MQGNKKSRRGEVSFNAWLEGLSMSRSENDAPKPRKLIRWPRVEEHTDTRRNHLTREIKAGRFPEPVQLGVRSIAFYEDEVLDWVASRPRGLAEPPHKAIAARHKRNGE